MRNLRPLFFLALLILPAVLRAQIPVGGVIEAGVAGLPQRQPDVAMGPEGDFVVGWVRYQPRDPSSGVFGRLYAANGSPRTREFRIGNRADTIHGVQLAMMDDGSFVAVFRVLDVVPPGQSLVAQRFTSKGRPLGDPITVAHGEFSDSEVGSRGDGSFVVTWLGNSLGGSISARVFGADGEPLGPESLVAEVFSSPRLAVQPDGSFLVVWLQSVALSGYFVTGRLFNADGTPQGESFQISDRLLDNFGYTYDTVVGADGNFLVTWFHAVGGPVQPAAFVRRYTPDGAPLGGPVLMGHRPADEIAAGPDGSFVSVWDGAGGEVVVRWFAANGTSLGPLVILNSKPRGIYPTPSLAGNGTGSFVAAWFGKLQARRDFALLVRRFRVE